MSYIKAGEITKIRKKAVFFLIALNNSTVDLSENTMFQDLVYCLIT